MTDSEAPEVAATTGDLIAAYVAGPLDGPGERMRQILERHPTVRREQSNAAATECHTSC